MNKKFLTLAAAAMMLAACSDTMDTLQESPQMAQQGDGAITFGASYVNRATTRAGQTGAMKIGDYIDSDADATADIQSGLGRSGFGVFAYYTGSDLYVPESYKPDFMYNQRVYNTSKTAGTYTWTYEPVKYWPNEFGVGAVSDEIDRLSFFAYAPYVSVNPSTGAVKNNSATTAVTSAADDQFYTEDNGDATTGIIGLSRNSANSDPYVKYVVSLDPSQCVDLCYGVASEAVAREGLSALAADQNLVDLTKPTIDSKIKFNFKHALAALNVQIDAAVDALTPGTAVDANTRIYVRKITFEGLTDRGMLNLNDHAWYDMTTGQAGLTGSLSVYDGRSDGREAVMAAVNESNVAFNEDIVQVDVNSKPGVTATAVNLFQPVGAIADPANPTDAEKAARLAESLYVIPTGQELRVTIVYDVETVDANLSGYLSGSTTHGISVENAITQTVSSGFKLQAGSAYTLKLHLGMNSVKFDVNEVAAWPAAPGIVAETSLPANIGGSLATLKTLLADAADDANGGASPDATEYANLKALYTGMYINAAGQISSAATATTVGRIAYISAIDEYVDDNTEIQAAKCRILVMANEDVSYTIGGTEFTGFPWWNYGTAATSTNGTATIAADYTQIADLATVTGATQNLFADWTAGGSSITTSTNYATNKLSGYDITKAFVDAAATEGNNKAYAVQAAYNYDLTTLDGITVAGYGTDATSGAAGHWFLPTAYQMILMGAADYRYASPGYTNGKAQASGVFATLSGLYWSSSEYSATLAWGYYATNGYWNLNYKASHYCKVRPVFAY